MSFRILYQDDSLVAIDKPANFHVHPPEEDSHKISNSLNCLYILKKQLGKFLYPVHRIDCATSGVLLFAFQSETAKIICECFKMQKINKVYYCVVRGWPKQQDIINNPIKAKDGSGKQFEAVTHYLRLATIELKVPIGKYRTTRYSLLRVHPKSGRLHQIRRHFDYISHPLIGDSIYGRSEHNRFFRDHLKISGLLLKAHCLELPCVNASGPRKIVSRWSGVWHKVFDLFEICPHEGID